MFIKHSLKLFRDSLQVCYLPNQKRRLRRAQKTMIFILSNILFIVIFSACGAWAMFRTSDKKVVSYFEKKGLNAQIHYTKFQGHQLRHIHSNFYDSLKPTLYFVHGVPGSSDNFNNYLSDSLLNTKANLISFDRLGYGYSEYGKAEPDNSQQAASLCPIVKKYSKKETPGMVIGWSYGGPIAAKMAIDSPELVGSVIMLAPALDPEAERYFALGKLAEWKTTKWFVPDSFKVAQKEKRAHAASLSNLREEWKKLQRPIIMMHGTKDKIVPYTPNIEFALKHFDKNHFSLLPVEGKGHVFPMSETEKVLETLLSELKQLEKKPN